MKISWKKLALGVAGIGIASAAGLTTLDKQKSDYVTPIIFNGQAIEFPYTDENVGETLIIRTDKETCNSFNSCDFYVAVKNNSGDDQNVQLQFLYGKDEQTAKIEEFKPQVAFEIDVDDFASEETCEYNELAKKEICFKPKIGSHKKTLRKDKWNNISKKTVTNLKHKDTKKNDKFTAKDQVEYWIPDGETRYFKAIVAFTPGILGQASEGEFYIKAFGNSAYGSLDPWYSSSWGYRMELTINDAQASSTQSNFPVVISTTTPNLKFTSFSGHMGKSDGTDMVFTSSDGTTKLDHEIEKYSSSTGETIAWVEVPTINDGSNTTIYLYYGNAAASDQQNITATWDSNYVAVYHLPNGTTLTALDSTANAINGTLTNTPTAGTGQMDGAGSFVSASSQYINLSDNGAFNTTAITYSAWVKATSFANGYNSIIQKVLSANSYSQLFVKSDGKLAVYMYATAGVNYDGSGSNTLSTGTWYYITATYDSSAGLKSYVNASVDASVAANGGLAYNNATTYISHDSFTTPRYWDGQIDEARVSNIARSADWIATEYNNQSSPSTFYVLGGSSVQNPTGGAGVDIASRGTGTSWYNTSWTYRKQITIDRTKLSTTATSTFSSFPLLFSVTDTDLKYTGSGGKVASSTGGDILFTASDGTTKLDHELEKYSSSTGETIAWIRIPTLAASSDHTLYIYFGNSGASNQQNATGVWDFNYKGVWHLPDGTNLTVLDSTGVNNGTNTGVTATSSKVDGGGAYADTNDRVESAIAPNYSSLTLEAWVKPNYFSSATAGFIFGNGNSGDSGTGFYFNMNGNNPINGGDFIIGNGHPYGGPNATWSQTLTENTWYHFVATWTDGVAPKIYINGSLNVTGTVGGAGALQTSGNNLSIGGNQTLSGVYFLKGVGDEFRVSNSVRSADWILTEYNNQSSPSTFYAYGALQAQTRQSSSGAPAPAVKSRGGVKFR